MAGQVSKLCVTYRLKPTYKLGVAALSSCKVPLESGYMDLLNRTHKLFRFPTRKPNPAFPQSLLLDIGGLGMVAEAVGACWKGILFLILSPAARQTALFHIIGNRVSLHLKFADGFF